MRFREFIPGIIMALNNEEAEFLTKFDEYSQLKKNDLSERDQYLAGQLVNKGLVIRKNQNGSINFFRRR